MLKNKYSDPAVLNRKFWKNLKKNSDFCLVWKIFLAQRENTSHLPLDYGCVHL